MTKQEIKQSYGICGLVCALCSYHSNCSGCRCKTDNCEVRLCCSEKGLNYCFECGVYPCDKDIHKGIRSRAFNTVAKNEGLDKLAEYLYINLGRGITYHRADGLTGDYDRRRTVEEVIDLLKNGKPDPYDVCPTYESKSFLLRLVSMDDAEDLLKCYNDPDAHKFFNSDNCTSDFHYSTLGEMRECIESWLDAYKSRGFIRYSVIDRQIHQVIGTIEIFGGERGGLRSERGVLRIDVSSEYENEKSIAELLQISDSFFYDFNTEKFITKAIPEAVQRINALT